MKSKIIEKASHLYQSGNVSEALLYYGSCLWNGQEQSLELVPIWFQDQSLLSKVPEKDLCSFIALLILIIDHYDETVQNQLWALCQDVLNRITTCEDRDDTSDRYVVECNLYRHMNEPQKALNIITKGLSKGPTTSRYTFAGLSYLDLEQETQAEHYIALGVLSDPHNASAYNDLGDYYFKKEQYQKARDCYYKVLESENRHDCEWAEPSWIFCCFMEDGNRYELERLAVYTAANPENDRAHTLCQWANFELLIPNVDYIQNSTEAIINGLSSLRESGNVSPVAKCTVSCQESASSINAVRLALEELSGQPSTFEAITNTAQDPPLDETIDDEGLVLWNYKDLNHPFAALPAPPDDINDMVAALASTDFSLKTWYEEAKSYADTLSKQHTSQLYATMIHPPKQSTTTFLAEEWLSRVQFAAVCIVAQISLHEIDRICKGQLDWPIIPAFTLAAWLASQDFSLAEWAENILQLVARRISRTNYCFFEHAYYCAAYLLPNKDQTYYIKLWQQRRALEN